MAGSADWIHCNSCYVMPATAQVKFYLTSCGHSFCQTCIDAGACQGSCKVCKQPAQLIEINRQMKPEVQQFFYEPKELQRKFQKQMNQVLDFQNEQRGRITKFYREQLKRANKMFAAYQADIKKRNELERNFKLLREEFRKSKEEVHFLRSQLKNRSSTPKAMQYRHHSAPNTNGTPTNSTNHLVSAFTSGNSSRTPDGASPSRLSLRLGASAASAQSPIPSPVPSEMTTPKLLGFPFGGQPTSAPNHSWTHAGNPVTPSRRRQASSPGLAMKMPFNGR